jgi:hypothetical protein
MNDKPFNPQPVNVRVLASFGLILLLVVIATVHAMAIVAGTRYAPDMEQIFPGNPKQMAPKGINFDSAVNSNGVVNTLPVNSSALGEIKTSSLRSRFRLGVRGDCIPCQNQAQNRTPILPNKQPIASRSMTPLPTTPRYSIELFLLINDPRSNQIATWFAQDKTLKNWRTMTNYNLYSPSSTTYKTRYVNHVPVESFPAILVTAPDGGHVYIASKQIPELEQLKQEIGEAVTKHKQLFDPTPTPPPPTPQPRGEMNSSGGLSSTIPDFIVNESQLASMLADAGDMFGGNPDCPDGQCDPNNRPGLLDRPLFDRLRDKSTDPVTGIIRSVMRPGENIFLIVIILALVVTLIFFVKRGMQ